MPDERARLQAAAERLAGGPVRLSEHAAGGNSRIYRLETPGGLYALKCYPRAADDPRDRLGTEVAALRFLRANGIGGVPEVHGADAEAGLVLMEWIEGEVVGAAADQDDLAEALVFLARVHGCRQAEGAAALPPAAEACLSAAEVVAQIGRRLQRLAPAASSAPELARFLQERFLPAFERVEAEARRGYEAAGFDFEAPLAADRRSLIPADFGFHNVVRRPDGRLAFVDFEYFGWDDPAKLAADFLLHPGSRHPAALRQAFAAGMAETHGDDPCFSTRLNLLYALYALRWALIVLNVFRPEHQAARGGDAATPGQPERVGQLDKAQGFVVEAERGIGHEQRDD